MASSNESYSTMKFTLNNGIQMPAVGFGTFRIRHSDDIMRVVDYALGAGYRMFDTAGVYGNEMHLREALRTYLPKYDLEREDVFITTKLSTSDHGGFDIVEKAYSKSLKNLGLEYVDLYLIHFPGTAKMPSEDVKNKEIRNMTWSALEELYDDGRANAIGVSNFTVRHLNELMMSNHSVIPAVNQVEWHPYYHQNELLMLCRENEIVLQAYSSLGGTFSGNTALLDDPVVKKIAQKLNVSSAQVLLVWALQQDIPVIPKSTNPQRIKDNINLNFKISEEDMKALDSLSERNIKYAWDPSNVA